MTSFFSFPGANDRESNRKAPESRVIHAERDSAEFHSTTKLEEF